MESLKERIVNNGRALNETVLKVDSFLNHQVDAKLMYEMGTYFKEYFKLFITFPHILVLIVH